MSNVGVASSRVSLKKRLIKRPKLDLTDSTKKRTKYPNNILALSYLNSAPWDETLMNPYDPKPVTTMQACDVFVDSCPHNPETERALFTSKARRKGAIIMEIGPAMLTTEQVITACLPVAYRKRRSDNTKNKSRQRHFYEFVCAGQCANDFLDAPENKGLMWVDLVACQSPSIFMQSASKSRKTEPNCHFSVRERLNKHGAIVMQLVAAKKLNQFDELLGDYVDSTDSSGNSSADDVQSDDEDSSY